MEEQIQQLKEQVENAVHQQPSLTSMNSSDTQRIAELEEEIINLKEQQQRQEAESQETIAILKEENRKLTKQSKSSAPVPIPGKATILQDREVSKLNVENEILKK